MTEARTCENCVFLSDGFRCQRVTSKAYSRKIPEPGKWSCTEWEQHPVWSEYLRKVRR